MNISVTIHIIDLNFSVSILNVHLEVSVSQNFDLDPSFHFMTKNGSVD